MDKDEALEALNAIGPGDQEAAHAKADEILLEFLAKNGHKEIAVAWESAEERAGGFWYA